MKSILLVFALIVSFNARADMEGILPGEPDPNTAPGKEYIYHDGKPIGLELLDDTKCPKGKKAYFKMKCGRQDESKPSCEKYTPVIECRKTKRNLKCKKPKVMVPQFNCD